MVFQSEVTFFFDGQLINHPDPNYQIVIRLNGYQTTMPDIKPVITIADGCPYRYTSFVDLEVYHKGKSSSSRFKRSKAVDVSESAQEPLARAKFTFTRELNRVSVYEGLNESIAHFFRCCKIIVQTAGFPIPNPDLIDPYTQQSPLSYICNCDASLPLSLSHYFMRENRRVIEAACEAASTSLSSQSTSSDVNLLEIFQISSHELEYWPDDSKNSAFTPQYMVYYRYIQKPLKKFQKAYQRVCDEKAKAKARNNKKVSSDSRSSPLQIPDGTSSSSSSDDEEEHRLCPPTRRYADLLDLSSMPLIQLDTGPPP